MIDFEEWRGPKLSFPVAAELVMVPEFDELVIEASNTFPDFWLVPPEDISLRILQPFERGENGEEPFNQMGASDLGLRLKYFNGDHIDYVLSLSTKTQPKISAIH